MRCYSDLFNPDTVSRYFMAKQAALPIIPAVVGLGGKALGALGLKGLGGIGAKALAGKALNAALLGSAAHSMLRKTPHQSTFRQVSRISPRTPTSFTGSQFL